MKQLLIFSLLIMIIGACSQDQAGDAVSESTAVNTETKPVKSKRKTKKREPKWVVAIDGLPELSGRIITAIGTIKGGQFSLVTSGFTASISVSPKGEISYLLMSFTDQNIRCMNYGGVIPDIDGTRVEMKGEVKCSPLGGDKSEQRTAQINAWFETKK